MGCFPGEYQSRLCNCMRWCRECLGKGCSDNMLMYVFPVGVSIKSELHLVMDAIVSWPIQCLLLFVLLLFLFKRIVGGYCPSVVTSGDNVTHKHFMEMRRLACDETPFLFAMPPRATTLAW
jgi:hypothetical protein